jgi:ABC-type nitrate/sulfonate/bicarbonate transport system permease component
MLCATAEKGLGMNPIDSYYRLRMKRIVANGILIGVTLFTLMPLCYFAILHHLAFFTEFEYYALVGLIPIGSFSLLHELRAKSIDSVFSFSIRFSSSFSMCLVTTFTWATLSTLYVTIIDPNFAENFVIAIKGNSYWEWTPAETEGIPLGYMLLLSPLGQSIGKIGIGVIWGVIVSLAMAIFFSQRRRVDDNL